MGGTALGVVTRLAGVAAWILLGAGLAAQSVGWRQAAPGYRFEFPRDHASHPDFKVEWWYYTGNVAAADGRRFGYQVTFFRIGVEPAPVNPSRWAVRDLFMAHLAITDIGRRRFQFAERLNRAGPGWAGADLARYRVWNEDWEAGLDPDGAHRLRAAGGDIGIDLRLQEGKPPVDQGIDGVSRKGREAGNAAHYYSLTRMPTAGSLLVGGERIEVQGTSWMDHEFGRSFLETGQDGWNWFALQLDDGTDVMVYEFVRSDGRRDIHSAGSHVDARGRPRPLGVDEFSIEPGERWQSARSGGSYPIAWRVRVPGEGLDLDVRAAIADQELVTERSGGVTYWEGAVIVEGRRGGSPIRGRGYVEMTGYAGAPLTQLLQ